MVGTDAPFASVRLGFGDNQAIDVGNDRTEVSPEERESLRGTVLAALQAADPLKRNVLEGHVDIICRIAARLSRGQPQAAANAIRRLTDLLSKSRDYSIELMPKLLACRGELIDLLISSGVSQHMEFHGVASNRLYWDGCLEKVPDSKEEVFASQLLTLIEKRKLTKLLTFIRDEDLQGINELSNWKATTFADLLRTKFKLDGKLYATVMYAIAAADDPEKIGTEEGCLRMKKYVQSIGRYGKMAYLFNPYGLGSETAQRILYAWSRTADVGQADSDNPYSDLASTIRHVVSARCTTADGICNGDEGSSGDREASPSVLLEVFFQHQQHTVEWGSDSVTDSRPTAAGDVLQFIAQPDLLLLDPSSAVNEARKLFTRIAGEDAEFIPPNPIQQMQEIEDL
ncbi:hypothetical protein EV182_000173 [Spiromyces aspiralis]|uniref:Uncharacterized protein n=1 Tax=Spiromyces aspiralis TaxID=68401 RepID=A0ACC1HHD6_9FUNG|nr:hypothetical protein EV182_000173 [Spiromyces aspiralis]